MSKIILTVGPPACGKSTWSLDQVRKSNGKFKRLNLDDIREMLGINAFNPAEEKVVQEAMYAMGLKFLRRGYDVIADNTNLSDKSWISWCEIASKVGNCTVEEKNFEMPNLNELLKRNAKRDRNVPEGVIHKMYEKWKYKTKNQSVYFPATDLKETSAIYDLADYDKPLCVIVDLDGTLAIHDGRSIFDFMRCGEDRVNVPLRDLLLFLKSSHTYEVAILMVSGRSDECLEITEKWLSDAGAPWDEIYLKPAKENHRKDVDFKKEIYENHIKDKYTVLAAFDDRDRMVDFWRSLNIPTYQVFDGDF
jgi:predicted kinase